MSSELGLFVLMLAPVLSLLSAYASFELLRNIAQWLNVGWSIKTTFDVDLIHCNARKVMHS